MANTDEWLKNGGKEQAIPPLPGLPRRPSGLEGLRNDIKRTTKREGLAPL